MKKVLSIVGLMALMGIMVGCAVVGEDISTDSDFIIVDNRGESFVSIVQDKNTGCMYLYDNTEMLITSPYYNELGEVSGCGESF